MANKTASSVTPTVPEVDLDRIRSTYSELKKMQVHLDPNPIEYGPKRFNNRIARVRAMLNRVDQIFLQTSEDLHYFQRVINAKKTFYELEKRELMVNDPRCRVGRSQQEREALADVQLRSLIEEIVGLEQAAHDLETVMVSIKSKRSDLKDAQTRMRDQMKLIEHDISMGARWGSNASLTPEASAANELEDVLAVMDNDMGVSDEEDEEEEEEGEEAEGEEAVEEEETPPEPNPPKKAKPKQAKTKTKPEPEPEEGDSLLDFLDQSSEGSSHTTNEEPVLVFGEKDNPSPEEIDILGNAEAKSLPDADHTQEAADTFLEELDPDAEDSADGEVSSTEDALGIDDLIASFADD